MDNYRVILDLDKDIKLKPEYSILIFFSNGSVLEASSVTSATAGIVKNVLNELYEEAEFEETRWLLRVNAARKYIMIDDRDIIVWSQEQGRIKENYASREDDLDYEDNFQSEPLKILVDDEENFLISLSQIGVIQIYTKKGENLFSDSSEIEQQKNISIYKNIIDGTLLKV